MSHSLVPLSRVAKRCCTKRAETRKTGQESEKERNGKTPQLIYEFFMVGKSIKIIVLFHSANVARLGVVHLDATTATLSAIKNLINYRIGKLEKFQLENVKISQFLFFFSHNTPPVRWETDHSKSSIQTGRCRLSVRIALGSFSWK